ncbi:uncharacterized protein [Leptinotarsa decemlineata]|uniref:uncharacterized protein n=1 Tax=Leptinotarsa decemlineata TaxID=7539 RepID=UPI003D30B6C9
MRNTMDVVDTDVENELQNKCRSCLTVLGDDMYNLFEKFDQDLSLCDIFKMTMNFEVEDDGLPRCFCKKCANVMVDFHNFKNMYQENNLYLKSVLANDVMKSSENHIKQEEENREEYTFLPESECILVIDDINTSSHTEDNSQSEDEKEMKKSNLKNSDQQEHQSAGLKYETISIQKSEQSKEPVMNLGDGKKTKSIEQHIYFNEDECVLLIDSNKVVEAGSKYENFQHAKYRCTHCNDYFLNKTCFIKHMSEEHQVIPDYDEKVWKNMRLTPSITTPLLNIHDGSVYLFCKVCEMEFADLPELQEHLQTHTLFLCHICGMSFKRKSTFEDHSGIHASSKLYPCPICNKRFSRKSVMLSHKKKHISPRQYVCEHCGKRFNENGSLNLHKKCVHLKQRNFHCSVCNLSFPLKATLQKHIRRRHTIREKTFVCSICNSSFAERAAMLRHFSKHLDSEKYTCSVCQREYAYKYSLMKHVRKYHSPTADLSRLSDYCEKFEVTNKNCEDSEGTTEKGPQKGGLL